MIPSCESMWCVLTPVHAASPLRVSEPPGEEAAENLFLFEASAVPILLIFQTQPRIILRIKTETLCQTVATFPLLLNEVIL